MAEKAFSDVFWKNWDEVLNQTLVPQLSSDLIRPCAEEDFQSFRKTLADNLHKILALLETILKHKSQWTSRTEKKFVKVMIILGEQNCVNEWNTSETVEIAKLLEPKLCAVFGLEKITQVLKDHETFLSILMFLRPKLLRSTWKNSPASVSCYQWILESTEEPQLKNYLPEVLPTALIIFDDYVFENQILGLKCIDLIMKHCQKSRSLKNLNYDEVVFEALEKMAHKIDKENIGMIIPLFSCISDLLDIMKYCWDSDNSFGWTKQDDILSILLNEIELQTNYECREAYTISLMKILTHSSIGKWSERLTRILSEYCADSTVLKITDVSLALLQTFLSVYQPKSIKFYVDMYSTLLKLRHQLVTSHQDSRDIIKKTDECLDLLNKFCPNLSTEIMENNFIKNIVDAV